MRLRSSSGAFFFASFYSPYLLSTLIAKRPNTAVLGRRCQASRPARPREDPTPSTEPLATVNDEQATSTNDLTTVNKPRSAISNYDS